MRPWFLAALLVLAACKNSENKSQGGNTGGEKPTDNAAAAVLPANRPLVFKVDDTHLNVDEPAGDFDLLSISELPPVEEWKSITVRNVDGRDFRGTKPLLLTGVRTMRMVTLESGAREFRVVEPSETEASGERIRHKMTDAKSVLIFTKSYTPPPEPEVPSELTFRCGGKDVVLGSEAIEAVPRTAEPGKGEPNATWALKDLAKAAKCPIDGGVRLTDTKGKITEVTTEQLADAKLLHTVKRNRRKRFNYRQWSLGDAPRRVVNVRGTARIEAL